MHTIQAIFQNGVFRPKEAVSLPDGTEVEVDVRLIKKDVLRARDLRHIFAQRFESGEHDVAERHNEHQGTQDNEALDELYAVLSERYESGDPYGAERHNEHQP